MTYTHFPRQRIIQRQLPQLRPLFERYALDSSKLDELAPLVEDFKIRFPLVGAFSSGKTSLINAALGESLLSVDITPETAVPAELHADTTRRFIGHTGDGRTLELSEGAVRDNRLAMLAPAGYLEIGLPHPLLMAHPHLIVVDLPGWDSGFAAHERVIDAYERRSLAYGVVVSADEGTLRQSLRNALMELATSGIPGALIITKSDKRTPEDVAEITRRLEQEIVEIMGKPPLAVAVTSIRKKDVDAFADILRQLEKDAEVIFDRQIATAYLGQLLHTRTHLELRADETFVDAERLQAEADALKARMSEFDRKLVSETQALDERIDPLVEMTGRRIETALLDRLESFTDRALSGIDIADDITGTARLIITEALRRDFEPLMLRYLNQLEDALPSRFDLKLGLNLDRIGSVPSNTGAGEFKWKALSTTLSAELLKIPHPLAKIAAVILPMLGDWFDSRHEANRQRVEEARQRESARQRVRACLYDAVRQIQGQFRSALREQVQRAKGEIASAIAKERADLERTFAALKSQIEEGETHAAAARAVARADLAQIDEWIKALDLPGASKNRRERHECQADGAQRPRHNNESGEGASTAQRSNRAAQ